MESLDAEDGFSSVPEESVDEFHRQGEMRLIGTMQVALAADQRSITMAGIFGAGAIALFVAVLTFLVQRPIEPRLISAVGIAALILYVSSILCVWAARPQAFHVAGYDLGRLLPSSNNRTWMLRYAAEDVQRRIVHNETVNKAVSRTFYSAIVVASLALPISLFFFFFWQIF